MTRFTPADEIGADDHDAIADRVDRGVAELDYVADGATSIASALLDLLLALLGLGATAIVLWTVDGAIKAAEVRT